MVSRVLSAGQVFKHKFVQKKIEEKMHHCKGQDCRYCNGKTKFRNEDSN
jgi:hypothetical protein